MRTFTNWLVRPSMQAIAVFGSILGLFTLLFSFGSYIYRTFSAQYIQIAFAISIISLSMTLIVFLYTRIYGRYSTKNQRLLRHGLSYRWRILFASQLCCKDDSYFISLTWMKMSRVLHSLIAIALLLFIYIIDPHQHLSILNIFGFELSAHLLLDTSVFMSIGTLLAFIIFTVTEINIISRVVAVHCANNNRRQLLKAGKRRSIAFSGFRP